MTEETNAGDQEAKKPFELFELLVAVLLGLAAIGTAWANFQSSLWNGKMIEAYSQASNLTTKAASEYNGAFADINHDLSVDIEAKKLIAEARDTKNPVDHDRDIEIASYLYLYQLSEEAYDALGLPKDLYKSEEDKKAMISAVKEKKETEEEESADLIPEEALEDAFYTDLDEAYYSKMQEGGDKIQKEADDKFEEGRKANDFGDHLNMDGVIFTVSLFFAGISLVFKTHIRWGFFFAGLVVFLAATAYLFMLPWA